MDSSNPWIPEVVIYHDPCPDGYTSFWLMFRHHNAKSWPQFDPYPYNYDHKLDLERVRGKRVLLADMSLQPSVLEQMREAGCEVIIFDHHESAEKNLKDYVIDDDLTPERYVEDKRIVAIFDMGRSGAGLIYDWIRHTPRKSLDHLNERTRFVNYIEASDTGRASMLPFGVEASAYIKSFRRTIEDWHILALAFDDVAFHKQVIPEGQTLLRYRDRMVEDALVNTIWETIGGHDVPVVNTDYGLANAVCTALLREYPAAPFVATYFIKENKDGVSERYYSLRSEAHRVSVSEVASRLGGGGHRNASGIRIPEKV